MAKILVIDDDAAIVDILKVNLEAAGHTVFSAMDGPGGVMVAAREKPDLITLDFMMPAGDGGTTHQRLRGNTFTQKTPILLISAREESQLPVFLRTDPNVRIFPKPIDMAELIKLVGQLTKPAAAPPAAPPPPSLPPMGPPPSSGASAPGLPDAPSDFDGGGGGSGTVLDLDL